MKDFWESLKALTHARIALGRAGNALPTAEWLMFKMAHSQARDSVWCELDPALLKEQLKIPKSQWIEVQSQCQTKQEFLLRPDLGRKLGTEFQEALPKNESIDCVLILADGLAAQALHRHAQCFTDKFLELLAQKGFKSGPVVLARYARVALGDAIGEHLRARSVLVLIGERPGLGSSESLSIYFTYQPQVGKTDAQRNCISNIQDRGIPPEHAAEMAVLLLEQALKKQLSGVDLKMEYPVRGERIGP